MQISPRIRSHPLRQHSGPLRAGPILWVGRGREQTPAEWASASEATPFGRPRRPGSTPAQPVPRKWRAISRIPPSPSEPTRPASGRVGLVRRERAGFEPQGRKWASASEAPTFGRLRRPGATPARKRKQASPKRRPPSVACGDRVPRKWRSHFPHPALSVSSSRPQRPGGGAQPAPSPRRARTPRSARTARGAECPAVDSRTPQAWRRKRAAKDGPATEPTISMIPALFNEPAVSSSQRRETHGPMPETAGLRRRPNLVSVRHCTQ